MRPRHNKLALSDCSIREFLRERSPQTLRAFTLSFLGTEEEIQYALYLNVQMGFVVYYPPQRKVQGRWGINRSYQPDVAGPRISPLAPTGELKYDLYSHARLAMKSRR